VPLIDPWQGECRAATEPAVPDDDTVRTRCNSGYARGACPRFVEGRGDAVRFHAQANSPGSFRILYSYERDCWPAGHGDIDYDAREERADCADEILRRQAEAFAAGYCRRSGAAV